MREQVITPRAGRQKARQTGGGGGQSGQRPAARRAKSAGKSGRAHQSVFTWRRALRWAPAAVKLVLAVAAGLLVFTGYRAAASASFFQLKTVEVVGSSRSSRDEIGETVRRVVGAGGVWNADLEVLTRELGELPWVRAAHVQRVLPSGLRVRVVEREPRMVARTSQGRLAWVDDEGVRLGPASADEGDFYVRGLEEDREEGARRRNRERLAVAARLRDDWARAGLTARVSEVNLHDLRDVRVQLQGDDSGVEVRLSGAGDHAAAVDHAALFRTAVEVLDERRQDPSAPRPNYIIMAPNKDPVLGLPANVRAASPGGASGAAPAAVRTAAPANERARPQRERQGRGDAAAVRERRVGRG